MEHDPRDTFGAALWLHDRTHGPHPKREPPPPRPGDWVVQLLAGIVVTIVALPILWLLSKL